MNIRSMLLWLALVIPAGFGLHQIKLEVQSMEDELRTVRREAVRDTEAIQVLRAEWSYLNEPSRIEQLSERHLGLSAAESRQIVAIDRIPLRPEAAKMPAPPPAPPQASPQVTSQASGATAAAGMAKLPVGAPAALFAPAELEPEAAPAARAGAMPPRAAAEASLPRERRSTLARDALTRDLLERLR